MFEITWIDILEIVVAAIVSWAITHRWMRKHSATDGSLTLDLTGDSQPVALDISGFDKMLTAKRIILDFKVILPEEEENHEFVRDKTSDRKN